MERTKKGEITKDPEEEVKEEETILAETEQEEVLTEEVKEEEEEQEEIKEEVPPPVVKKKEVVVEEPVSDVMTWKKVGKGSFRFNGKIIKENQTFQASPSQISKTLRNIVIPLGEIKTTATPPIKGKIPEYTIQPRGKSKNLFDVVSTNGKVMNEKVLNKADAQRLLDDLSK